MANLIYPNRFPIPGKLSDKDKDQPTGYIDYLMIHRHEQKKDSKNAQGYFYNTSKAVGGEYAGLSPRSDIVYLSTPPNINVTYGASYDSVNFGTAGMMAGNLLAAGSNATASSAAEALKTMATDSMPEFTFKTLADATRALGDVLGSPSDATASDLLAVSQGKIFNPYEEMIFKGTGFRSHNFQFKLVARNENEAIQIGQIIAYLKQGMLPNFSGGSEGLAGTAETALGETNIQGRYLTVPDKFKLAYYRLKEDGTELTALPHYKFQLCVLENLDVSYTPDGQYVSFKKGSNTVNKLFVPAVTLNMNFKEVAYITAAMAGSGY